MSARGHDEAEEAEFWRAESREGQAQQRDGYHGIHTGRGYAGSWRAVMNGADMARRSQCAAAFGGARAGRQIAGLPWCEVSFSQRRNGFGMNNS